MSEDQVLNIVTGVVKSNGGRLVGRTRFQKTVYLLQKMGLPAPFDFDYHYYGPYSADLAEAIDAAAETSGLSEEIGSGYHGTQYSIFSTDVEAPPEIAGTPAVRVKEWLQTLARYSGTDLELASTILFLRDECGISPGELDSKVAELKPVKASPPHLQRAWHLLRSLRLDRKTASHD